MAQNQNKTAAICEYGITMYRAVKELLYRNAGQVINKSECSAFFTSKCKAVDKLRFYSEDIPGVRSFYEEYLNGERFAYKDLRVSLFVYKEREGVLVFDDGFVYKEVVNGKFNDNSGWDIFDTF